jgi:hypothetical protein
MCSLSIPAYEFTVSIADINNDGHNDYLTGNIRGGMMMFSDVNWGNDVQASINDIQGALPSTLNVYPNPAKYPDHMSSGQWD